MHASKFTYFEFIFLYIHIHCFYISTQFIFYSLLFLRNMLLPIRIRFTALSCFETNIYLHVFLPGVLRSQANKAYFVGNCEEDLPKKPVGRLSVNCQPSVDRQSADCWPTVGRVSTNSRPTVGRQSAVRRPTDFARNIGYLSADSRPTAHRQSGDSW